MANARGPYSRFPNGRASDRAPCARFHRAVELVGSRWSGAILYVLFKGAARFSVIRAAIPEITDRMLSQRLRELEAERLVVRSVVPSTPVQIEYALTAMAIELARPLIELADWAHRWLPTPEGEAPHVHAVSGDVESSRRRRPTRADGPKPR